MDRLHILRGSLSSQCFHYEQQSVMGGHHPSTERNNIYTYLRKNIELNPRYSKHVGVPRKLHCHSDTVCKNIA